MRKVTGDDFRTVYAALAAVAKHPTQRDTPRILERLTDLFVSAGDVESDDFDPMLTEAMTAFRVAESTLEDARSDDPLGGFWSPRLKCGRIARLVLRGEGRRVPDPDRAWVRAALAASPPCAALADEVPPPAPPAPAAPCDGGPVAFSYGRVGTARRGVASSRVVIRERDVAGIVRVEAASAPVVCGLVRPGGTIDVRLCEGTFLRPVLSPGSWEPVSHADFVRHALEAPPWADNPFLARPRHGTVPMGLAEFEVRTGGARVGRNGARTIGTPSGATVSLRAKGAPVPPTLVVIDGVVHRATTRPTLAVLHVRTVAGHGYSGWCDVEDPSDGYALAWRLGDDLHQASSQATVNPTSPFPRWDLGGTDRRLGLARPTFGLGDAEAARTFVARRAAMPAQKESRTFRHTPEAVTYRWHLDAPDPVAWADPHVFPADPIAATRALAGWTEGMPDAAQPSAHGDFEPYVRIAGMVIDGELGAARDAMQAQSDGVGRRRPTTAADRTLAALGGMCLDEVRALLRASPDDDEIAALSL